MHYFRITTLFGILFTSTLAASNADVTDGIQHFCQGNDESSVNFGVNMDHSICLPACLNISNFEDGLNNFENTIAMTIKQMRSYAEEINSYSDENTLLGFDSYSSIALESGIINTGSNYFGMDYAVYKISGEAKDIQSKCQYLMPNKFCFLPDINSLKDIQTVDAALNNLNMSYQLLPFGIENNDIYSRSGHFIATLKESNYPTVTDPVFVYNEKSNKVQRIAGSRVIESLCLVSVNPLRESKSVRKTFSESLRTTINSLNALKLWKEKMTNILEKGHGIKAAMNSNFCKATFNFASQLPLWNELKTKISSYRNIDSHYTHVEEMRADFIEIQQMCHDIQTSVKPVNGDILFHLKGILLHNLQSLAKFNGLSPNVRFHVKSNRGKIIQGLMFASMNIQNSKYGETDDDFLSITALGSSAIIFLFLKFFLIIHCKKWWQKKERIMK